MSSLEQGYTARSIIFNKLYRVKMHNIDGYSREYIERYGLPTSGNRAGDRYFAEELIEKYLTIAQMAEFRKQGISLRVINSEDLVEMYKVIHRHIKDFNDKLEVSISYNKVPMEDLQVLSDFASEIYPLVANVLNKEIDKEDVSHDYGMPLFDLDNIFRKVPKDQEIQQQKELDQKYYQKDYTVDIPKPPHEEDMLSLQDRMNYRRQHIFSK